MRTSATELAAFLDATWRLVPAGILILKVPAYAALSPSIVAGEQMPFQYGVSRNRDHGEEVFIS